MTAEVPEDPAIDAYVQAKNVELKPFTGKVLGNVRSELIRSRTEESNIGNLIADAMLDSVKDQGVQLALTNAGGIRADVGTGELTMQKLMEVLPFGNLVATFEIKGSDLWQVFDHGFTQVEEGCRTLPADGRSKGCMGSVEASLRLRVPERRPCNRGYDIRRSWRMGSA